VSAGTVLIVDDLEDSRELLSGILSAEGYDVRPADSGELALAAVGVSPPDVILLDRRMPGMDGLEVCRLLKGRPETRNIPIIFLSSSRDFGERLEVLESGAVDFVSKPFQRQELLARLKTHLELARLRKDLEYRVAERTAQLQAANDQLNDELKFRRRFEAELLESEQRFRSMADTAPAIMFMVDPSGYVTYINQWGLTFAGSTLEQFAGQSYVKFVHPEDSLSVYETLAAALEKHTFYQTEYRNRRCDGEYRWLAETGIPRFVDGRYVGHIGVALDVTLLKRSQEQAVANQKLESLGLLTAGIAHTFNNLASTIVAHADLALSEIPDESPVRDSVSTIATVALRASEIVSLLIAYTGRGEPDTAEPVELSSLIQAMVQLLKASVPPSTSLHVNLSKEPMRIWASAGKIRQVVLNLIVNASEALQARPGTVSISTVKIRLGPGNVHSGHPELPDGDYVRFEVSDPGCGMTEELKGKIFDPFFSTKSLGRGLGLPSVQGIVRDAGGAIGVVSSPGQGSRFQVWFPLWSGGMKQNGETTGKRRNQSGIVLLAEDEDDVRLRAASALQREGFSVMATHSGLAALELFERYYREIDVVILDMTLPGLSGPDVCAEMRVHKPDLRVLFTDADGADEPGAFSQERVLRKPYQARELIRVLRAMTMAPVG